MKIREQIFENSSGFQMKTELVIKYIFFVATCKIYVRWTCRLDEIWAAHRSVVQNSVAIQSIHSCTKHVLS